jgi:hypothetical protein
VQYIAGEAVCACWWSGEFYGTEEGFLIVEVNQNNKFTWEHIDYDRIAKVKDYNRKD